LQQLNHNLLSLAQHLLDFTQLPEVLSIESTLALNFSKRAPDSIGRNMRLWIVRKAVFKTKNYCIVVW